MLLIRCPYCEMERPEVEFKYGGEAHLTRPDPNAASDAEWTDYLYFRANPEGRARRTLAPRRRLRPLLQLPARHRERPHPGDLQDRRTAAGGAIDRALLTAERRGWG